MPGLDKCVQCGSILKSFAEPVRTDPPRMSGWQSPFRGILRSLRSVGIPVFDMPDSKMPEWVKIFVSIGTFGAILSLVPGLGHVILGRFNRIVWWILGWVVLLFLSIFLFGGGLGTLLLGLTFGLHVWIAMSCSISGKLDNILKRLVIFALIAVFYLVVYRAVWLTVFQDFIGGRSTLNAPYHNIEQGDYLLARRSLARRETFKRADIGVLSLDTLGRRNRIVEFFRIRQRSFAQVIAVGGEHVQIRDNGYIVDGNQLDKELFPVPHWIGNREPDTTVPANHYFISAEYTGNNYNNDAIVHVCTIEADRMEAKVFIRWLPLTKRGFLKDSE